MAVDRVQAEAHRHHRDMTATCLAPGIDLRREVVYAIGTNGHIFPPRSLREVDLAGLAEQVTEQGREISALESGSLTSRMTAMFKIREARALAQLGTTRAPSARWSPLVPTCSTQYRQRTRRGRGGSTSRSSSTTRVRRSRVSACTTGRCACSSSSRRSPVRARCPHRHLEALVGERWSEGSPCAGLSEADQHREADCELHQANCRLEEHVPGRPGRGQDSCEFEN